MLLQHRSMKHISIDVIVVAWLLDNSAIMPVMCSFWGLV